MRSDTFPADRTRDDISPAVNDTDVVDPAIEFLSDNPGSVCGFSDGVSPLSALPLVVLVSDFLISALPSVRGICTVGRGEDSTLSVTLTFGVD